MNKSVRPQFSSSALGFTSRKDRDIGCVYEQLGRIKKDGTKAWVQYEVNLGIVVVRYLSALRYSHSRH
jgi:hypothetical protein